MIGLRITLRLMRHDEGIASGCLGALRALFAQQHQVAIAGNSLSAAVGCCHQSDRVNGGEEKKAYLLSLYLIDPHVC